MPDSQLEILLPYQDPIYQHACASKFDSSADKPANYPVPTTHIASHDFPQNGECGHAFHAVFYLLTLSNVLSHKYNRKYPVPA